MKRYKVLIVDDEQVVRDGISACITWENYDLSLIGATENAVKALDIICGNSPDIVITDIKMPVMDGLDLIRETKNRGYRICFIIMSGYSEFDYARQAVKLGVADYLIKPVRPQELVAALETAKCRISGEPLPSAEKHYSKTITQVLAIVDEELDNIDLSLKWIAVERLFMDGNYLSKLFQKETGGRFSNYLTAQRMETALKLFRRNDEITVNDVAERVGFGQNPQYFSTVFKKYFGVSPSNFYKIP